MESLLPGTEVQLREEEAAIAEKAEREAAEA